MLLWMIFLIVVYVCVDWMKTKLSGPQRDEMTMVTLINRVNIANDKKYCHHLSMIIVIQCCHFRELYVLHSYQFFYLFAWKIGFFLSQADCVGSKDADNCTTAEISQSDSSPELELSHAIPVGCSRQSLFSYFSSDDSDDDDDDTERANNTGAITYPEIELENMDDSTSSPQNNGN